jgi:hypothetical protein
MNLRLRILLALLVLGLVIAGMFGLEQFVLPLIAPAETAPVPGVLLDEEFTRADLRYGPQATRPYYTPLAIDPSGNASAGDSWYLMYIELNGTPVSGNPDVRRLGALNLSYRFTGLAGKAAFHVYGIRKGSLITRTNRQDGFGRSGFVVYGQAGEGAAVPATEPLIPTAPQEYTLTVANFRGENADDLAAAGRTLRFDRAGSGLDALHLTTSLGSPKGQITETANQRGSFYITATGENPNGDLLLLVAVNRKQPEEFSLHLTAAFVGVA